MIDKLQQRIEKNSIRIVRVITRACHFYVSISFITESDPMGEVNFDASTLVFYFEKLIVIWK